MRVAVIGGGVAGLACALELRRRGAEVVVYERGIELGAGVSQRAAGMLGVGFEWAMEDEGPALVQLALRSGEMWPEFASRVEKQGGGGIEYASQGAIVLARNAGEASWLEKLAAACQARELPAHLMSAAELKRTEKAVTAKVSAALLLEGDRQVDAPLLLVRLGAALARQGVRIVLGRNVERIIAGKDFLLPDGERFDRVVLATGAREKPVFVAKGGEALPTGLPGLVPVKGQMLALAVIAGAPKHVVRTRDVYVAPKARWVLVGATVERGANDTEVDPKAIAKLRQAAGEMCAALVDAPEVTAWAGVRPGTPDNAPLLGETKLPGVYAALGLYRNGILLAPAVAGLIAEQVIEGEAAPRAFSPLRFGKN